MGSCQDEHYQERVKNEYAKDRERIIRFLDNFDSRNSHDFYTPIRKQETTELESEESSEEEDSDYEEVKRPPL